MFLKSQARSKPLFYWQTIQQHWHTVDGFFFYRRSTDTLHIFFFLPSLCLRCNLQSIVSHESLINSAKKEADVSRARTTLIPESILGLCCIDSCFHFLCNGLAMSAYSDLIETDSSLNYQLQ